jgi:hypothetical protein
MNKYSEGKIYKIVCNKTGLFYIGSTYRSLEQRLKEHICNFNSYINNKSNKRISSAFVLIKNDYQIVLIENYPCNTKKELIDREFYYISNLDCVNMLKFLNNTSLDKELYIQKYNEQRECKNKIYHLIVQKLGEDLRPILFRNNSLDK